MTVHAAFTEELAGLERIYGKDRIRLCGSRQALVTLENWRSYGASVTIAGFTGRAPSG
jgi:hypothetical protein